jgi:hypothetical protein
MYPIYHVVMPTRIPLIAVAGLMVLAFCSFLYAQISGR